MSVYSMDGYEDPVYLGGVCQRCGVYAHTPPIHNGWHRKQVELIMDISNAVSDLMGGVPVHIRATLRTQPPEDDHEAHDDVEHDEVDHSPNG